MNEHIENQILGFARMIFETGYDEGVKDGTVKSESYISGKEQEAYYKGLREAWECARKIVSPKGEGYNATDFEVFGVKDAFELTARQAISKLKEYEERCEEAEEVTNILNVGDEIKFCDTIEVVTHLMSTGIQTIDGMGNVSTWYFEDYPLNGWEKTGRHFPQIAEVLSQMQEEPS